MSAPLFDEIFVAGLPSDTTESDVKELFEPYAVVKECWVGHKKQLKGAANTSFSSIRVQSHAEAVAAKKALHGSSYKDRNLIVKWAANQRLLWVGSLPESVTNEALQAGFSHFGTVERALVVADAQNPLSRRYGFVLFEEKRDAQKALSKCQEGVLLFAKSPEPVRVDWARIEDVYEGYSDALAASKKRGGDVNPAVVAHLAAPGTQEHTAAMRIKQLQLQYEQTKAQLKQQIAAALAAPNMNAQPPMMPPQMNAGPQFVPSPQPPMAGMAPLPMAPPPLQPSGMAPVGMVPGPMAPAGNPMGTMANPMGVGTGSMLTLGMGAASQPAPMMNQNSLMAKGMGDGFNSMPPPSKAQMRKHDRPERFTPLPPKELANKLHAPPPRGGGLCFIKAGSLSMSETEHHAEPAGAAVAQMGASSAAPDAPPNFQPNAQAPGGGTMMQHAGAGGLGAGAGGTDVSTSFPGAKPPGSHDHRGIGFSGAASASQASQPSYSSTMSGYNASTAASGPRPPPLPATPYSAPMTPTFNTAVPGAGNVPSYPPPTSMGGNFTGTGFSMGTPTFSAPQMHGMGTATGGIMQTGYSGYAAPGVQGAYGNTAANTGMVAAQGIGGMGQYSTGQAAPAMQAAMQQPMSGYTATTGTFGNTSYAPPPQQTQMY